MTQDILHEIQDLVKILVGAGIAYLATYLNTRHSIKASKESKKEDEQKQYLEKKGKIFSEAYGIHLELIDKIKQRDFQRMANEDGFYLMSEDDRNKRHVGLSIELDIIEAELKVLEDEVLKLKNKLFKELSTYQFNKKFQSEISELQREFVTKGLNYDPSIWNGERSDIVGILKFQREREKLYNGFHVQNVVFPLTNMLNAIMHDK